MHASARSANYDLSRFDVWAKERAMLAELDARYEDEINRIYCEHLGRMIQMGE